MPRTDVVFIERYKNLRQTLSLFLRSGFSRVPVIGDNLDDVVGIAYLKGHRPPRLRGAGRRVHPAHRRGDAPGHFVPDSAGRRAASEMQAMRQHRGRRRRVRRHRRTGDDRGRPGGDRRRDRGRVRRRDRRRRSLDDGSVRVSSRYPIDDLDELFGFEVEEEDVDSVGGLMAKHLGVVPIPGRRSRRTGCASRRRRRPGAATRSVPCGSRGRTRARTTVSDPRTAVRRGPGAGDAGAGVAGAHAGGPKVPPYATRTDAPTPPRPSRCPRWRSPRSACASRWRSPRARRDWRPPWCLTEAPAVADTDLDALRDRPGRVVVYRGDAKGTVEETLTT